MTATDLDAWADGLLGYLTAHIDAERQALDAYEKLLSATAGTLVGELIGAIIADERRHHQLFSDMTEALRTAFVQPSSSPLTHHGIEASKDELRATTEELIDVEREDARELVELRRRLSEVADTRQWLPLVDIMELDTEKHIRILTFIGGLFR